jgi:2-keto-4-pentenoate hydratase
VLFNGCCTLRLAHYLETPRAGAEVNQSRYNAHSDYDGFTFLSREALQGGLEIRLQEEGEWVSVAPPPGCLVVNIGDLLARWSNDRWKAALHRVATGESTYGYKVGCTSRAVREKFGIAESIYGRLWTSEQRVSGAVLHARDYATLAIEGELACTIVDMAGGSSTERWVVDVSPIIELHHAEWHCDVSVRAAELVAKNGIHAGVVHYNALRKPQHRFTLGDPALLDIPITVTIDGEVVEAPSLRALELGGKQGPLATISWLAQRLEADGCGEQMKVGDVVLTATPGSLIRVDAESSVRVEFDGMVTECTVVE